MPTHHSRHFLRRRTRKGGARWHLALLKPSAAAVATRREGHCSLRSGRAILAAPNDCAPFSFSDYEECIGAKKHLVTGVSPHTGSREGANSLQRFRPLRLGITVQRAIQVKAAVRIAL